MNNRHDDRERPGPFPARSFLAATLVLFLVHLPGIFLFRGEFTDGVLQTVYFDPPLYVIGEGLPPARYVPPLYPALIRLVSFLRFDPLLAGRLLSLAAYCGTGLVLAWFAFWLRGGNPQGLRKVGYRMEWVVWWFWAFSPVANRWAFHCMTDMTFCFFATLSLGLFLKSSSPRTHRPLPIWLYANIAALFAVWTRYQGYALMGVALLSIALILFRGSGKSSGEKETPSLPFLTHRNVLIGLLVIVAWAQTFSIQQEGRSIHGGQFAERSVYPARIYIDFALAALRYFPYAVTPPLFVLFLLGIGAGLKRGGLTTLWTVLGLLGGIVGLVVQTGFLSFQFRYGLPLLPWVCLMGGIGLDRTPKRFFPAVFFPAVIWLAGFTGAVLYFQHGTFADIENAMRRIPAHLSEGTTLWAREEYNFLPDGKVRYANIKTSVWSGVPVRWLDSESLDRLEPGDLIVDPSVTPVPDVLWHRIRARWKTEALIEETWESLPLTPGEVLWVRYPTPEGERLIRGTSDPQLMRFRYKKQYYSTTVYRLLPPD